MEQARRGAQQLLGVVVAGVVEDLRGGALLDDLAEARERGRDVPLFSGISDDEEADALADLAQVAHSAYKGKNQARHVDYSLPERPLAFWRELAERYSDRRAGEGV